MDIYGQLISCTPELRDDAFGFFSPPGRPNDQCYPAVAYNSTRDEYLVVWQDKLHHTMDDIYGWIVDTEGNLVGNDAIPISTAEGVQQFPAVAYNSHDNHDEYLVVWEDFRNGNCDIYGQRLSAAGEPQGDNFYIIEIQEDQQHPDLVYNSQDNLYLVVWQDKRCGNLDIYGRRVESDGALHGDFSISSSDGSEQFPAVACKGEDSDNECLVVWQDNRNGDEGIYGQWVGSGDCDDALLGDECSISTAANNQESPDVAYNSQNNEYIVVWQDNDDIYGQLVGLVPTPLTVTSITPDIGANDEIVNITDLEGTGFLPGATVKLVGASQVITATNVKVESPAKITCTFNLIGAAVGKWDVVVNTDGQSGELSEGFTVTNPMPTITRVDPNKGPNNDDTPVTITGSDFVPTPTAELDDTSLLNVTWRSPTTLTATVPAGMAVGVYTLTVANPGPYNPSSSLTDAFTVTNPTPTITGVNPDSGPNNVVTPVTITGADFVPTPTVTLDSRALAVTSVAPAAITATVPAGMAVGVYTLTVTNPGPYNPSSSLTEAFTVTNPTPTITRVDPNSGPNNDDTPVTITGSDFVPTPTAELDDTSLLTVTWLSPTTLTATVPTGMAVGVYTLTVTNPGPKSPSGSLSNAFTVTPPKEWRIYLPIIMKNYAIFRNGDFETGDFSCWTEDGELDRLVVDPEDPDNPFSSCAARLGNPDYSDGNVPVGHAWMYQTITVPSPSSKLEFKYYMYSYDIKQGGTGIIYDTFEVSINNSGFILQVGNPAGSTDCETLWESGLQQMSLNLGDYNVHAGDTIQIWFCNWNRVDKRCNTWTYIDDISVRP